MSSKHPVSKLSMLNNMLKAHFHLYIKRKTITFATEIFNLIQVYMKETSNYYRIKTEWTKEDADGQLQKTKTEELVYATSYSEAEATAYALIESENRERFSDASIEIIKTKISEMLYNETLDHDDTLVNGLVCNFFSEDEDSGVGIYSVKVMIPIMDEKSGKEKMNTETIFTPASSNTDAAERISKHLKHTMSDFIIRDIKFDKAEAILWPPSVQEQKQGYSM